MSTEKVENGRRVGAVRGWYRQAPRLKIVPAKPYSVSELRGTVRPRHRSMGDGNEKAESIVCVLHSWRGDARNVRNGFILGASIASISISTGTDTDMDISHLGEGGGWSYEKETRDAHG